MIINKRIPLITLAASVVGGIVAAVPATATPPCQVNWKLNSNGVCEPYYSVPTNGYNPYGPSPESVGIHAADVCAWRAKGISEFDIVDQMVAKYPRMVTPNVEDWVRQAEQDNCPEKLVQLAPPR
ncbi:hypothetical protein [Mycolicibacter kumamotonensis]|uniref:DUF732 domain-containing protein n=1 Tax=Mycolicibacter kumamotonensis TaxID=354243 RepID=A0A1B8S8E6_9MYCO|nr:hypothetical protein [Mycolicibacter kumamotonensis]OBY28994.1 hypothetical protein ACT18_25505 [Mycolicibacter kumamotonensis]